MQKNLGLHGSQWSKLSSSGGHPVSRKTFVRIVLSRRRIKAEEANWTKELFFENQFETTIGFCSKSWRQNSFFDEVENWGENQVSIFDIL